MYFLFTDTATHEIYTLSLHDGSSDLPEHAQRPTTEEEGHDQARVHDHHRILGQHEEGELHRGVLGVIAGHELRLRFRQIERSEEHTSELQSQSNLVCRLLLEKKKNTH